MTVNRSFSRRERVGEQIRRDLAELIRVELKDPRVGMVSLTGVDVSPDYAHAKVYFSTLAGREHLESTLAGLQQAASFLRRELGKRLSLRGTPELRFVYDESLERGADLSELIRRAVSTAAED
ncbi:MAG: 30S ribosome-binding factor RbfA [Candidatus Accumulibacter sp.]|jgi:ribosome-binding factor A|nr:30S ribosome-binding factor RbfA [Accumulibacter sp.]